MYSLKLILSMILTCLNACAPSQNNGQVSLAVKIPVLTLYVAAVAVEDGTVHFFDISTVMISG
jgi:murein L,D-transpeptidase YcbB/YkuD